MQGNYEKYESNFKTVKIALLIGVILGIIKIIFRLFFGMVSILFLNQTGSYSGIAEPLPVFYDFLLLIILQFLFLPVTAG